MKTNPKEINYYVWTGQDLLATCNHDVTMPGGGHIYASIGKIKIVEGDVLSVDYGRSLMVYTRSGKGYEAEFPYGKVTLAGTPAYCVLDGQNRQQINLVQGTQDEFNAGIKKQQKRIEPEMVELINSFVVDALKRQQKQKEDLVEQKKRQKNLVENAVEKMEQFFYPNRKI